jgi:hypothetical protein
MNKCVAYIALAACLVSPAGTLAQSTDLGAGVGARVGTLGVGAEAAIALTKRIVVRGGIGFQPVTPTATFHDINVSLTLPTMYNVGLDFYLNGAFRIGGGILFKKADPEVRGTFSSSQSIGGTSFTPQQIGTLTGVIDSADRAPYVLIGFGNHTAKGVGLFLDLGLAFLGNPTVRLGAIEGTLSDQADPLKSALAQESVDFENDMRTYLRFWPIMSVGLRIGLG